MPDTKVRSTGCGSINSCPAVKNILILDSDGKRVAVKYYSDEWPTNSAKLAFEKSLFGRTLKSNARTEAEITIFDSNIVIYKFVQDLHFFITGGDDENELLLATVLQGLFDAIALRLRNTIDKREALENLDVIFLCIDEVVDQGMILETDANAIAGKVAIQNMDASATLSEQGGVKATTYPCSCLGAVMGEGAKTPNFLKFLMTISQALASAREHLTKTLLK
ncbi:coatomer subunit zeta-2-like [Gossypium australe]|uniref:Coatomer subunit zeta n=1 Tax=Gossypium australe TaxID=47621 RepID=A0A5B6WC92_9ROSI|nr:coatomer subunit zeta-2-like [Gossypium australe]